MSFLGQSKPHVLVLYPGMWLQAMVGDAALPAAPVHIGLFWVWTSYFWQKEPHAVISCRDVAATGVQGWRVL